MAEDEVEVGQPIAASKPPQRTKTGFSTSEADMRAPQPCSMLCDRQGSRRVYWRDSRIQMIQVCGPKRSAVLARAALARAALQEAGRKSCDEKILVETFGRGLCFASEAGAAQRSDQSTPVEKRHDQSFTSGYINLVSLARNDVPACRRRASSRQRIRI
jgi:hypothetical protein